MWGLGCGDGLAGPPPPHLIWIAGGGGELVCKFPPAPTTILISAFELRLARSCWVATRNVDTLYQKEDRSTLARQHGHGLHRLVDWAEHTGHKWDWTRIMCWYYLLRLSVDICIWDHLLKSFFLRLSVELSLSAEISCWDYLLNCWDYLLKSAVEVMWWYDLLRLSVEICCRDHLLKSIVEISSWAHLLRSA